MTKNLDLDFVLSTTGVPFVCNIIYFHFNLRIVILAIQIN